MTIAGYVPYFTIYTNAGTISLAPEAIIAIPAPVVPPVEPPVSGGGYAGGGVRRIRQFAPRKRKREDEDEPLVTASAQPPAPVPPPAPPPLPPQPGLMAGLPIPPITVLRSPKVENDDDEAIALLFELLS